MPRSKGATVVTKKLASKKIKITKDMKFQEVFEKFPTKAEALAATFMEAGMHCFGCAAGGFESIEMGCKVHGFSDKNIVNLVSKLNELVEKT